MYIYYRSWVFAYKFKENEFSDYSLHSEDQVVLSE